MKLETGLHEMSEGAYREYPAIAHSGLKDFAGHHKPEGRFLLIGSAFHHCLLQPEIASALYCTAPVDWKLNTKEGKQALADFECEQGKIAVRPQERAQIVQLCRSVLEHPQGSKIIKSEGRVELVALGDLAEGVQCKGLIDKDLPKCIVDLKTTGYGNQKEFEEAIVKYGYDSQGAYYSDLYMEATGEYKPFVWLVVSKRTYECWVTQLQPYHLATGRRWYGDMLHLYAANGHAA